VTWAAEGSVRRPDYTVTGRPNTKAKLRRRRGLKRGKGKKRQIGARNQDPRRIGQPHDLIGRDKVAHQSDECLVQMRNLQYANATRLDLSADRLRCARDERIPGLVEDDLIVGHKTRTLVNQAQRKIRLSGTRDAAHQNAGPCVVRIAQCDTSAMHEMGIVDHIVLAGPFRLAHEPFYRAPGRVSTAACEFCPCGTTKRGHTCYISAQI